MKTCRPWKPVATKKPDPSRIAVFKSGIEKGLIAFTPTGGHMHPISTDGANELWKKAQKNAKKNNTSEVINNNIPHRRPLIT